MFRSLHGLGFVVLGFSLLLPIWAAEPAKQVSPEDKRVIVGQVAGKLTKRFPNRREMEELKQALESAKEKGDFQGIGNIFERFKEAQKNAFGLQVQGRFLPVEVELSANVDVRLKEPPTQFDNKGNIVKLTPVLLKKLKGADPKKPGYTGQRTDLHEGQTVVVYFLGEAPAKPQPGKPQPKVPAKQPAPTGQPAATAPLTSEKIVAAMIFILEDPRFQPPPK